MATTVLIVDDHPGFRSLASSMFASEGFEVAAAVADGEAAIEAVQRLHPDVVLLDIQLPGIDGFEVARLLAAEPAAPCVVLTSSREASAYGSRLSSSPVLGFLPKAELSCDALAGLLASA